MSRVTITLDFECGWGAIGDGMWRTREAAGVYDRMRDDVPRFVDTLGRLGLELTWACVGAMISDPADIRIDHLGGRFATEACRFLDEARPTSRDARDLLGVVRACRYPQSFGSHTYTHVLLDDPDQSRDGVARELERARAANDAAGIASNLLVFPRNRAAHLDLVAASGFHRVRLAPDPPTGGMGVIAAALPGLLGRGARSIFTPPAAARRYAHPAGPEAETGTALLDWGTQPAIGKRAATRRRIRRSLDAARSGQPVHLWVHPYNFSETPGLMSETIDTLEDIARLRDRSEIIVEGFA
ncbi:polysaccharide deacetylase family protein [uncultured Jannaschia sp.]|uniref:polysaccharide deacetylase family protein n=1 Tax=uncultured Jannaschia sp. TaxID=293347 RepID=UPI00262F7CF9|nr:polysaccharide deacetylase family protein [uncultured Jannaschia sp.]